MVEEWREQLPGHENCDYDEDEKSTKAEAEQEYDREITVAALPGWARAYLGRTWAMVD